MGLKELYNTWSFNQGNKLGNKTPREATEGKVATDFLPNTYQTEIRNRTPGNKTVTQATGDDSTNGTFQKATAFKYYRTLFSNNSLRLFRSKIVHPYNAQGTVQQTYLGNVSNAPGALYSTNS